MSSKSFLWVDMKIMVGRCTHVQFHLEKNSPIAILVVSIIFTVFTGLVLQLACYWFRSSTNQISEPDGCAANRQSYENSSWREHEYLHQMSRGAIEHSLRHVTQEHKREGKFRNHRCQWDTSSGDHEHLVLIHLVEVETQPAGGATGNTIYVHSVSSRDPECLQPMFTAINPVKDESLWFGWRCLKEVSCRKGRSPSSCSRSSTCDTPWSPPQSFSSSSCPPVQSPVDRMQNDQTWNFFGMK